MLERSIIRAQFVEIFKFLLGNLCETKNCIILFDVSFFTFHPNVTTSRSGLKKLGKFYLFLICL